MKKAVCAHLKKGGLTIEVEVDTMEDGAEEAAIKLLRHGQGSVVARVVARGAKAVVTLTPGRGLLRTSYKVDGELQG